MTELALADAADEALISAVDAHIRRTPEALRRMPVLLDAPPRAAHLAARQLREAGVPVIGLLEREGLDGQFVELPLVPQAALGKGRAAAPPAASPAPKVAAIGRIHAEPVRSGQQVYAEGTDLIVLAPVSAGAEVVADGSVHVYAPLRGRAIAGARGDERARIFCLRQEAELIAVAGTYAVAEQIQDSFGEAVQVHLAEGRLRIERLGVGGARR